MSSLTYLFVRVSKAHAIYGSLWMQQIAYEYAKRKAILVLVARREQRLRVISENARQMGAKQVAIMAADVVKGDDCRRFVNETINFYGRSMSLNPNTVRLTLINAILNAKGQLLRCHIWHAFL